MDRELISCIIVISTSITSILCIISLIVDYKTKFKLIKNLSKKGLEIDLLKEDIEIMGIDWMEISRQVQELKELVKEVTELKESEPTERVPLTRLVPVRDRSYKKAVYKGPKRSIGRTKKIQDTSTK